MNSNITLIEEGIESSDLEIEEIVAKMNLIEREDDEPNKEIEEIKPNSKSYRSIKELCKQAY